MKKAMILFVSLMICCCGCSSGTNSDDEIYEKGYAEGYQDALDSVLEEIPWNFIDTDELRSALYDAVDDEFYAEDIADYILDYCEVYDNGDLRDKDYGDDIDYLY